MTSVSSFNWPSEIRDLIPRSDHFGSCFLSFFKPNLPGNTRYKWIQSPIEGNLKERYQSFLKLIKFAESRRNIVFCFNKKNKSTLMFLEKPEHAHTYTMIKEDGRSVRGRYKNGEYPIKPFLFFSAKKQPFESFAYLLQEEKKDLELKGAGSKRTREYQKTNSAPAKREKTRTSQRVLAKTLEKDLNKSEKSHQKKFQDSYKTSLIDFCKGPFSPAVAWTKSQLLLEILTKNYSQVLKLPENIKFSLKQVQQIDEMQHSARKIWTPTNPQFAPKFSGLKLAQSLSSDWLSICNYLENLYENYKIGAVIIERPSGSPQLILHHAGDYYSLFGDSQNTLLIASGINELINGMNKMEPLPEKTCVTSYQGKSAQELKAETPEWLTA